MNEKEREVVYRTASLLEDLVGSVRLRTWADRVNDCIKDLNELTEEEDPGELENLRDIASRVNGIVGVLLMGIEHELSMTHSASSNMEKLRKKLRELAGKVRLN